MFRLRNYIFSNLLSSFSSPSSTSTCSLPSLHHLRLLSAAAPPKPGFAVEDYLVATCGLTRLQALKASTNLSHLRSSSKADAVVAFLAGLGLSNADIAAVVTKDPRFLCASVHKNLAPRVAELTGLGLSRPDIARLIPVTHSSFRCSSLDRNFGFWLAFFGGSFDKLLLLANKNYGLLVADLEKMVKPNIALLGECGLDAADIAKLCFRVPYVLTRNPERVRKMVACAKGVGVPLGPAMFSEMLRAIGFRSQEEIAARVEYLKETLSWSDDEVRIAASKAPLVLAKSEDMLRRRSHFLISEVGLEPVYIANHPLLLCFSLEGRLRPRHYVLKFLMANGLLARNWSYHNAFHVTEKVFKEKFICPHVDAAPGLAQDYATACRGEVPTRFRFA